MPILWLGISGQHDMSVFHPSFHRWIGQPFFATDETLLVIQCFSENAMHSTTHDVSFNFLVLTSDVFYLAANRRPATDDSPLALV
jgi:hypothetical protein